MKRFILAALLLAAALPSAALDEEFLKAIRTAPGKETLVRLADEALRDHPPADAQLYLLFIESRRNAVTAAELSSRVDKLAKALGERVEETNALVRDLRDDLRQAAWLDERFSRFHRRLDDNGRQLDSVQRRLEDIQRELNRR